MDLLCFLMFHVFLLQVVVMMTLRVCQTSTAVSLIQINFNLTFDFSQHSDEEQSPFRPSQCLLTPHVFGPADVYNGFEEEHVEADAQRFKAVT